MDFFVGAATGCLKSISMIDNSFANLTPIKDLNPKEHEITSMVWSGQDQTEVLTALRNRQLKLYSSVSNIYSDLFNIEGGKGLIKGLYVTKNENIISGVESGEVIIWDRKGNNIGELIGGNGLLCLWGDADRLAVGGKECPVKVFDIEKNEVVWVSKNVPPDHLQLRVPVWETDVRIIPETDIVVTGTGTHEIRMYDMRAQRRPLRQAEWLDEPITAISLAHRPYQVFAGNTRGEMSLFDLRGRTKILQVCKFKGQAGSIRSIDAHPTEPYVASCGIDRFARIHDVTTKKLITKVYCKARLNKVLIRNDLSILQKIKNEEIEEEENWKELGENANVDSDESVAGSSGTEDVWEEIDQEQEESDINNVEENEKKQVQDEPIPAKKRRVQKTNETKKEKTRNDEEKGADVKNEPQSDKEQEMSVKRTKQVKTVKQNLASVASKKKERGNKA